MKAGSEMVLPFLFAILNRLENHFTKNLSMEVFEWSLSSGSGLGYLDYFGEMVECQVSKCSPPVPSTDGCRRRRRIETMQVEVG